MRRQSHPDRTQMCVVLALASSCVLGACIDLFHSTDFGSCTTNEAGQCIGGGPDGSRIDAGHPDATRPTDGSGSGSDSTAHHDGPTSHQDGGGPTDATATDSSHADAPHTDAPKTPPDTGVDAGTNFCTWDETTAASYAADACLWLGACVGVGDLNDLGNCYPLALMAYDCKLNPNQRVHGALHEFWDELRDVKNCAAVKTAVFGPYFDGGVPPCVGGGLSCDLSNNILTTCVGTDGGYALAVNCEMRGYQCSSGVGCTPPGGTCTTATNGSCPTGANHNLFTQCQTVASPDGGGATLLNVGRDCTYFGAGRCIERDGGAVGCEPEEAGAACDASILATCADGGGAALGCATGRREALLCGDFGTANHCTATSVTASSSQLVQGCYSPLMGAPGNQCAGGVSIQEYTGPSNDLIFPCADAGLGSCNTSGTANLPYCEPSH